MKWFRLAVVFSIAFAVNFAPMAASAAGLIPCGGPGEEACQACHVTQLINNVVAWLVIVLSIVATILIVVAGFKLMTSGGNAAAKTAAKDTFLNIFIGFLLILGGWLLIDTLMKALVTNQVYGVWNQIQCLQQPGATAGAPTGSVTPGSNTTQNPTVTGGGTGTGAQCNGANTACSVQSLQAAGLSAAQANVMSCIAMTESGGNPNSRNPSSACGTFQVVRSTWNNVARGSCADFSQCTNAACNTQVAQALVARNGFSAWTCPGCNSKAQECVNRYSNIQ